MAVSDILVEIGSLDGACGDTDIKKGFNVASWSLGLNNHPGSGTDGKADFSELNLTLEMGKGNSKILEDCACHNAQAKVKLTARKTINGKATPYTIIELKDCLITSYHAGGGHGGAQSDSCTISYKHVSYKTGTVDDKSVALGNEAKFDLVKNSVA